MIIGIDHGNKQIKSVNCSPFISGIQQSITRPFGKDILLYDGIYYTLSNQRIPYRKDKTEDNRFFVLTLFAIAREIEQRYINSKGEPEIGQMCICSEDVMDIELAVGLPPAHFGTQNRAFVEYLQKPEIVNFELDGRKYFIYINDTGCYPQAYAAAATMLPQLIDKQKVLILDIGGFTADYMMMNNGRADLSTCDSLENGVILLYNKIRSKVGSELDMLLEESDIDAILMEKPVDFGPEVIRLVEHEAQEFINDLFSTLRERMLDLRTCFVVFVGGGAILLRRQIEKSGKVVNTMFIEDINANAHGYEYLYKLEKAGDINDEKRPGTV